MENKDLKKEATALQTRIITVSLVAVLTIYLALSMFPASASLIVAERSTKTIGETTITWDSSFEDLDYRVGATITMSVTWTVDEGAAEYDSYSPRGPGFTPKSKKDPADGTAPNVIDYTGGTITASGSGWVVVEFAFTDLHWSEKHEQNPVTGEWISAYIGNAKFKLSLQIDTNGDDVPDTLIGYGVNIHVEDFTTPPPL